MNQKPTLTYPSQFAFLIGLVGIMLIVSAVIVGFLGSSLMHVPLAQVAKSMMQPEHTDAARFLNTLASLLSFALPAVILARVLGKKPFRRLGFNTAMSAQQLLLVLLLVFASMMMSGALGSLNEWIPLPKKLYDEAKAMEDLYKDSIMNMATMKTMADYLVSLLVIAAFPALCEELLFRGGLQQVMIGWTRSKWAGIIITSILFSAIHFSYFGFLPRLALGMVLGLLFYYSKNIWFNILLHFLYNAMVVTQLYVLERQGKPIDKTMDENVPMWWGLIALVVLIVLLRYFRQASMRTLAAREPISPENIVS